MRSSGLTSHRATVYALRRKAFFDHEGFRAMELHEALTEIAAIRRQVAFAEQFRGYRALPVAVGAGMAFIAALAQPLLVSESSHGFVVYLSLWVSVAIIAGVLPVVDVCVRNRQAGSLHATLVRLAFEQFAPCVVAGGMLTAIIGCCAPQVRWMLPGLWAIVFSLGLFASYRLLPPAILQIAIWYLLTGGLCLALGPNIAGLAPWTMALTFGVGQAATAVVLSRKIERAGMAHKKPDAHESSTGRFAYEGLNRTIHERARLGIMASLAAHADGVLFTDLKQLCALTDGNLNRHLLVLQQSGYVEIWKGMQNRRPQTLCRLTRRGRAGVAGLSGGPRKRGCRRVCCARREQQRNPSRRNRSTIRVFGRVAFFFFINFVLQSDVVFHVDGQGIRATLPMG